MISYYIGTYNRYNFKYVERYDRFVDTFGNVFRFRAGQLVADILKVDVKGYVRHSVRICRKTKSFFVHRIVAETFIANPDNLPTVDHINRVRDDNRVDNLRWASYKDQCENSSRVLLRQPLGIRWCEDKHAASRAYSVANKHKLQQYRKENSEHICMKAKEWASKNPERRKQIAKECACRIRANFKSQGFIHHRCYDGKRRWHLPGDCPCTLRYPTSYVSR